jgi:hypothetical protein
MRGLVAPFLIKSLAVLSVINEGGFGMRLQVCNTQHDAVELRYTTQRVVALRRQPPAHY